MARTLSIREFNSRVSRTIAEVEAGESVVITRGGKAVVRLVKEIEVDLSSPEWATAYRRMVEAMENGLPLGGTKAGYEERTE